MSLFLKRGETDDRATLKMHNICFTYPTQPMQVINHVDLTIEAGQHIALLGKTGCGKSTLLQLINALLIRLTVLSA